MKLFIALLLLALAFSGCTQQAVQGETATLSLSAEAHGETILEKQVGVQKGSNAFEAMKENVDIKFQEFDFGAMVEEIEGVKPAENEYWALYVNGEYASKGISDYSIEEDMEIEWKLESFEAFPLE